MKFLFGLCAFLTFFHATTFAQTDVPDAGSNSPMSGGSWLRFLTGSNATSIIENWGLNISGGNTQPVKIRNASLLVGYTSNNQDFGQGNLMVNGNVGIGTSGPQSQLDLTGSMQLRNYTNVAGAGSSISFSSYGAISEHPGSRIRNYLINAAGAQYSVSKLILSSYNGGYKDELTLYNGNVGVGTFDPQAKLDVSGAVRSTYSVVYGTGVVANFTNASDQDINFTVTPVGASDKYPLVAPSTSTNLAFGIGAIEKMRINSAGNVLIGQKSQQNTSYKLDVAGNIRANQITVNSSGADFVFANNYHLKSLKSVAKFIETNHHLPEIESADKMVRDGMDLAEMNKKLLQKVEELTLYLINKDKEDAARQRNIIRLQKALKAYIEDSRKKSKTRL